MTWRQRIRQPIRAIGIILLAVTLGLALGTVAVALTSTVLFGSR